jgi:hypothetical protein
MIGWRRCGRGDEVVAAARRGDWAPDLRAHAAACAACRDLALLSSALQGLASSADAGGEGGPLPEPGLILRKAQLLARLQARDEDLERVKRPVTLAAAASLAGAGGLLAWSGWWAAAPLLAALALLGGLRVVGEAE